MALLFYFQYRKSLRPASSSVREYFSISFFFAESFVRSVSCISSILQRMPSSTPSSLPSLRNVLSYSLHQTLPAASPTPPHGQLHISFRSSQSQPFLDICHPPFPWQDTICRKRYVRFLSCRFLLCLKEKIRQKLS